MLVCSIDGSSIGGKSGSGASTADAELDAMGDDPIVFGDGGARGVVDAPRQPSTPHMTHASHRIDES
jgi:hypothetical protein